MPGRWITPKQEELYMSARQQGDTQVVSAAKSGISERSGRSIEQGRREDPRKRVRKRTRPDPLAGVWEAELKPLLEKNPKLMAITLLEHLQATHPGAYEDKVLRTLQRRVKQWRAVHGPEKEVMFRQAAVPGRQGLSDFTQLKGVDITIKGEVFDHRLYHFRLAFSHWSYLKVIQGGESYSALAEGLQCALLRLGGSPQEHHTDSLSAAYKNLSADAQADMTQRYGALCEHYGMKATRNNPGRGHENGSVESAHGHLKRRIKQTLILRGHHDFDSVHSYQAFLDEVTRVHNRRNATSLSVERPHLQALPRLRGVDYTQEVAVVSSSSTIDVKRVTYTVPSRLIAETLQVRVYDDRLIGYVGHDKAVELKRVYPRRGVQRARQVDYRHVIGSLVKKPQAFRYSRLRDDLLPNVTYEAIWRHVDETMEAKAACKFIVRLLHLAASQDCEAALGQYVMEQITQGRRLSLSAIESRFRVVPKQPVLELAIEQHALMTYNQCIPTRVKGVAYVS